MWEIFDILYSRLRSIERRPVWKTLGSNKAYITRHPNNLWSQERQGGKETRVGNVQNLLFPFLFFFAFLYRHQAVNKRRHPFDLTQTSSSDTHWEIFERPAKNSFYLTNTEQKIVAKLQGQMSSLLHDSKGALNINSWCMALTSFHNYFLKAVLSGLKHFYNNRWYHFETIIIWKCIASK